MSVMANGCTFRNLALALVVKDTFLNSAQEAAVLASRFTRLKSAMIGITTTLSLSLRIVRLVPRVGLCTSLGRSLGVHLTIVTAMFLFATVMIAPASPMVGDLTLVVNGIRLPLMEALKTVLADGPMEVLTEVHKAVQMVPARALTKPPMVTPTMVLRASLALVPTAVPVALLVLDLKQAPTVRIVVVHRVLVLVASRALPPLL